MKEVDSNKEAWSRISREHYDTFKARLKGGKYLLNSYIRKELGDLGGKDVIHLQCNTGADTILLSRLGAKSVVGIDLVPENVYYAERLAADLTVTNTTFIASDIMTLSKYYEGKHDVVFTSEGVLGWLPDLEIWARTVKQLLRPGGFLYVFDSHPFAAMLDEGELSHDRYKIKYPYFRNEPWTEESIGGYASEIKYGVKTYFWTHKVSDIINGLVSAGLKIEYFHEYPENFFDWGGMKAMENEGLFYYEANRDKYPMSFSLKATNTEAAD